ncbi:tetratricopeptide repeat protein [Streptomyces paradoxus]|uniref:tetratricopeptide repeat protein n=1 Tax=Streptomyces paradoxus TaxID=66375 RepID=UPI0036393DB1
MTSSVADTHGGDRTPGNTFRAPTAFQTGPDSIQHNYFYPALHTPVSWPHQVGVLPRQADCFQHRAAVEALAQAVAGGGTAVLCQVLAGTGGVGKTQLAAHHARALLQEGQVDLLLWATATSREAITTVYAQTAAEVLSADPGNPEQAARAFLAWLEPKPGRQQPCRWLIVLDDLADPADLRGLWPPASPHGRTLVTTRRRDAVLSGSGRRLVNVGLFTEEEAAAYLTTALAAHGRQEPADQLAALAEGLGHLPLALSQAVAYLLDANLDCATYRQRLTDRARTLTDVLPDPSGLPDDQATTVAAAWTLSIDRADELRPVGLARPMLHLAAMLDPNGIPATVLTSSPVLTYLAKHGNCEADIDRHAVQAGHVKTEDAVGALRALHRLSLIDHEPSSSHQTVRVHQLIQRAARDTLTTQERDDLAYTAADALKAAWPDIERDSALAQALRVNSTTLIRHAEQALYRSGAHELLFLVGESLGGSGQSAAAATYFHRLETATHRQLGPDHPDTLTARQGLAVWRGEAGAPVRAVTDLTQLLADRIRVQGNDHPDTLQTRDHLANRRGYAGNPVGAVIAYEQLLIDRIRVLGKDHPDTLSNRHQIAYWRSEAGDQVQAVTDLTQLLADRIRVQGNDHPATLITRGNLAYSRWEVGDRAGALAAYEQVLTDQMRVVGKDHPHTLISRGNLARWRWEAGDRVRAVAELTQLLEDRKRALGNDHPDTLSNRHQIASWRWEGGDRAGAITELTQLLEDRKRALGNDHPHTLDTRDDLAYWRWEAGDRAGAITELTQLLEDRKRVLGNDHPVILDLRKDIARWRGEAGNAAGAVAGYEQLLQDQVRMLGSDHPDTLTTRKKVAHWRGEAGDAAGAVAAYEQLLQDQVRELGSDHPDTLTTRKKVAHWRGEAGDAAGAVAAYEQLLADRPDAPHALTTCQDLAYWRGEAGDAAGAAAAYEQLFEGIRMTSAGVGSVRLPLLPGWEDRSQTIVVRIEKGEDEFAPNLVVVQQAANGQPLDQFIAQHAETLAQTFDGLEVGRNEQATLGGRSGHLLDYTFTASGKQYRQTQFLLLRDTSIITFTATDTSHHFSVFWPIAKRVIEGASFTDQDAQ